MLDWLLAIELEELATLMAVELLVALDSELLLSVGVGLATQALSAMASALRVTWRPIWRRLKSAKLLNAKSLLERSLGTGFPLFVILSVKMVDSSCFVAKCKRRNFALGHEGNVHR